MPRRSLRSVSSPATPKKRQPSSAIATSERTSKRLKSAEKPATAAVTKVTPKKSKYFESEGSEDEDEESPSEAEVEESGYEDEDGDASAVAEESSEAESEGYDEDSEEEKPKNKKRGRGRSSGSAKKSNGAGAGEAVVVTSGGKGKELWRPGVKTGLGPGKQVFIKLPKARSPGRTPYEDSTIHPNTMAFLGDLKRNNEREWMKMHDADYRTSKKDWDTFVECLTEKIIEKDETIPELPAKDLTFRIYRDVRFSSDQTPYKPYFSAAWSRTGRKGPYAAYYCQIGPNGGSFVGSGLWMPEAAPLALLRRSIDRKSHKIKNVLTDARIRKEVYGGISDNEKKAVKAFVDRNQENALKTKPKGYEADNKNIDLLRLRNYTMGRKLKDEEALGPGALGRIAELIGIMTPFVTYLNSVVMPDDDEESTDEDDTDDDEDDEEATP